ncbi:MAG: hypothetical protein AAF636_22285 [Pseudomonadota bacterium]
MKDLFDFSDGLGSRLPAQSQIKEAVLSTDPDAPLKLAQAHADDMMKGAIQRAEFELSESQERARRLTIKLDALEREKNAALSEQHLRNEVPPAGKRQPFWQRFYNGLKCVVAITAPLMGGAYLVSTMQDQSYTLAENPLLAVLTAGPLLLFSFAASSWALLPSDDRRAERRTGLLLGCSIAAFVIWGALIALRFGVAQGAGLSLSSGFDPTIGATSVGGPVWQWLEANGIAFGALYVHLLAEGLLSAACISSALLAGRKVLVVDTDPTSHREMLDAEIQSTDQKLRLQSNMTAEMRFRLNQSTAMHGAIMEEVTQAVKARRQELEAQKTSAVSDVLEGFLKD